MLDNKEKDLLRLIEVSKEFIESKAQELSCHQISDYMLELSGAKYVVFNKYDDHKNKSATLALSGVNKNIKKAIEILGFTIVGKVWDEESSDILKIKHKSVTVFGQLTDISQLTPKTISYDMLEKIQRLFSIGEIIIVNITKEKRIIGNFVLIMDKNQSNVNLEIVELYASQVAFLMDRTIAFLAHEKIRSEYERFFAISLDLFCITDRKGTFLHINDSWERLLGYPLSYLKGRSFLEFVHPDDTQESERSMVEVADNKSLEGFINRFKNKNGGYRYIEWRSQLHDGLVYSSGRDVTEKHERQKEVEFLSFHDYLTGLYNRRYMEDAIKRLNTARNLPLTLMILDINGLKLINDAFGHEAGDKLIKKVGDIIKTSCRSDDIIGRIGGDEFLILLPNTDYYQAKTIKERIISAADNEYSNSLIVSIAAGYAVKTMPLQDINLIEKTADKNMYRNKSKYGKLMRNRTIEKVLNNIFKKDDSERIHAEQVSLYSEQIARAIGLTWADIEDARVAGLLHDIGKITIPSGILNKVGTLTESEWEEIHRHSITSYNILKGVDEYAPLAEAILYHHERPDGKGYPEGLTDKDIPLLSKIFAVADAYESMRSIRHYRKTKTKEQAISELEKFSGTQFDPEIVDIFVRIVRGQTPS